MSVAFCLGMGEVSMLGMSSSDNIRENIPILVFVGETNTYINVKRTKKKCATLISI